MDINTLKKRLQDRLIKLRFKFDKMFYQDDKNSNLKKIRLSDNQPITDTEYLQIEKICDIFTAISDNAELQVQPPEGGVFWSEARTGNGPFDLHLRKDRNEIDHSYLFNTRFRDFPGIVYEMDEVTPVPDFWVRRYIRLANAVAKKWQVRIPARFGEIGWGVNDFPVNRLTSINQERITTMHLSGVTRFLEKLRAPKIMEIGAGSGELGYVLCNALPKATWYDCDLLGSLVYSAIHLAILLPKKRHCIYVGNLNLPEGLDESLIIRSAKEAASLENAVVNIPNFLLKDFIGHLKLDMAYNTYSFGEMPQSAAEEYAEALSVMLQERGILFEQNGSFPENNGHNIETVLSKYFKQKKWERTPEFDLSILNGDTRTWTFSEEAANGFYTSVSAYQTFKLINSTNDADDKNDVAYPASAWQKIAELFPNCI